LPVFLEIVCTLNKSFLNGFDLYGMLCSHSAETDDRYICFFLFQEKFPPVLIEL
jgi:hypothetical protein